MEPIRRDVRDPRVGLVGVREYPRGVAGGGDVDSGPLLLGVSASASVVTLAAARVNGDLQLGDDLDREADLLVVPLPLAGGVGYAFGALPVGDAFLVWARTREPLAVAADPPPAPRPGWLVYAIPGLLLTDLGLVLALRPRTGGRPGADGRIVAGRHL